MEPDCNTPLLKPDDAVIRCINTEEENFSDSSGSDNQSNTKRRTRLPFHYPHVHRNARVRREAGSDSIATYQRYRYYNKLTDPTIDTLSIPDHVIPQSFFFPFASIIRPIAKQSSIITIFSIWNTMMGSSLLSIPWAIQQAGFGCGIAILIIMGCLCFYTAYRIVGLRSLAELPSSAVEFPDLCRHLLGPWAERGATFFSLIPLFGGAVVYWVLMSNFLYFIGVYLYGLIESYIHGTNSNHIINTTYPDGKLPTAQLKYGNFPTVLQFCTGNSTMDPFYKYWSMDGTIPFYIAVVFAPIVSMKSPGFFSKLNAFGTLSIVYFIIFIIAKGFIWGVHFDTVDPTSISYVHLFKNTFPVLVGTLSLSFFIHNCVLSIMRNQKKPENNGRDLAIAYVLVGATYLIIGGVFFVTFPFEKSCIEDNLLNNFRSNDVMAVITRAFLLFQMWTLYPLIVYILRVQVMHFLFGTIYPSWKPILALNAFVLTICILFNIYLPKVGTIIRYCGAISGLAYIFTLPCVTYMKALKDKKQLTLWTKIIHYFIILIGICNFISQFLMHNN